MSVEIYMDPADSESRHPSFYRKIKTPRGKVYFNFPSLSYVIQCPLRICPHWFLSPSLALDHLLPLDTLHSLFHSLFCAGSVSGAAEVTPLLVCA